VKPLLCITVLLSCLFVCFGNDSYASTLTYQPVVILPTPNTAPRFFAVGDFNADGKPDIAALDYSGKTISVYLNQGGGSFSAPVVTAREPLW
jgi:hypothetical protein